MTNSYRYMAAWALSHAFDGVPGFGDRKRGEVFMNKKKSGLENKEITQVRFGEPAGVRRSG